MANKIAKKEETQLAGPRSFSDAPEMQEAEAGENIQLPRIVLMQSKRQEIKEKLCEDGDLFNTVTKQSYGKTLEIVPVFQLPNTRIRWQGRDQGGGLLCISRNKGKPSGDPGDQYESCASCPFYKNFHQKEGCSLNHEMVVLVKDGDNPLAWEPALLAGSSGRPSDRGVRDLIAIARNGYRVGVRLYEKSYILTSVLGTNKKGDEFYSLTCTPGNKNQKLPPEQTEVLDQMMRSYSKTSIDTAGAHGEEQEGDAPDGF